MPPYQIFEKLLEAKLLKEKLPELKLEPLELYESGPKYALIAKGSEKTNNAGFYAVWLKGNKKVQKISKRMLRKELAVELLENTGFVLLK